MHWWQKGWISVSLFLIGVGIVVTVSAFPFKASEELESPSPTVLSERIAEIPQELAPFVPPPLTLERVFSSEARWTATLSASQVRSLLVTGDVLPGRSVNARATEKGDFKWPFEKTASLLQAADITLINLEGPILENCPVSNEGMIFCGDPRHVDGLVYAGVDVASLANNHSLNYGVDGLESTIASLSASRISPIGVADPVYREARGLRFAFLGFNAVGGPDKRIAWADTETLVAQIVKAKAEAEIVVVMFHWGVEYTRQPTLRERSLAHLAIEAGADLVLGNHPHWYQAVEIYRGKLVAYSHGNFVFDQMWSRETREGIVGRYLFYDKELVAVEFLPVFIEDYGQPRFLEGDEKARILEIVKNESLRLNERPF